MGCELPVPNAEDPVTEPLSNAGQRAGVNFPGKLELAGVGVRTARNRGHKDRNGLLRRL
jgi:hypothetical protein